MDNQNRFSERSHDITEPKSLFTEETGEVVCSAQDVLEKEILQDFDEMLNDFESGICGPDDEGSMTSQCETVPKQPVSSATYERQREESASKQSMVIQHANIYQGDIHYHQVVPPGEYPDAEATLDTLRTELHGLAEEVVDDMNHPGRSGSTIRAVKLQISNQRENSSFDEESCYTRRKDCVYRPPLGDVALTEIFNQNSVITTHRSGKRTPGNTVMITGQAGIGKTMITKMIVQLLLDGDLLPETEFIFYIKFREIDFTVNRTLVETLLLHSGCGWEDFKEHEKIIYSALKDNPNVVVIFDGLDEADSDDFKRDTKRCDPMRSEKVSNQLKNLIRGTFLPHAKVVLTSRPRESHHIHKSCRPPIVLRVLGLDKAAQYELGRQICGAEWPRVHAYVERNPQIQVICSVPVMCILVYQALMGNMAGDKRLDSVTSVLEYSLNRYIRSEHVGGDLDLRKLSSLAWNGFLIRKIIFSEEDLISSGIDLMTIQAFMSTKVSGFPGDVRLLICDKKSFFSHLIWQEFFTAIHAMFVVSMEEFTNNLHRLTRHRWEVVARFMFGLSNKSTSSRILTMIGASRRDFAAKRQLLIELSIQSVQQSTGFDQQTKIDRIFQVCEWAREINDITVTNSIASQLPRTISLIGHLMPSDVTNLMLTVKAATDEITIDVKFQTIFMGGSMLELFNRVSTCRNVKMRSLYLSRNIISDADAAVLSKCLCGDVQYLYLDRTCITALGFGYVAEGIRFGRNKIQELNLTEVKMTDEMATLLSSCIDNIEVVFLRKCGFQENGLETLSNAIAQRNEPLIEINLRENVISDRSALALAGCFKNVRRMYVHDCGVGVGGLQHMARAIRELTYPMHDWFIHHNLVGDAGAELVASCLHNIRDEIRMEWTGVTQVGLEALREARNRSENKPLIYLGHIEGIGDVTLNQ